MNLTKRRQSANTEKLHGRIGRQQTTNININIYENRKWFRSMVTILVWQSWSSHARLLFIHGPIKAFLERKSILFARARLANGWRFRFNFDRTAILSACAHIHWRKSATNRMWIVMICIASVLNMEKCSNEAHGTKKKDMATSDKQRHPSESNQKHSRGHCVRARECDRSS